MQPLVTYIAEAALGSADPAVANATTVAASFPAPTSEGKLERSISLPVTNPTCVCLGGPGYRTLFITAARKFLSAERLGQEPLAGSVLAIEVEVPGMPEKRFGPSERAGPCPNNPVHSLGK